MSTQRTPDNASKSSTSTPAPQGAPEPDPAGQSPEDPIHFANTEVGRGNEERANAEPEPAALHDADVPGVTDPAEKRRQIEADHDNKN